MQGFFCPLFPYYKHVVLKQKQHELLNEAIIQL